MDSAIMAANERQDFITQDSNERDLYFRRQMAIMDYNSGINGARQEGIIKGKNEKARDIASKLKNIGIPIEKIIESTGLSQHEIERLP